MQYLNTSMLNPVHFKSVGLVWYAKGRSGFAQIVMVRPLQEVVTPRRTTANRASVLLERDSLSMVRKFLGWADTALIDGENIPLDR